MKHIVLVVQGLMLIALLGCSSFVNEGSNRNAVSSSLVDYLYPNKDDRNEVKPDLPLLQLPVKVGLAFVPSSGYSPRQQLSIAQEMALLEKVKTSFSAYDYIDRIDLIPSTYLRNGRGFDALEQLARLHDVDVMALVSYDQVMQTIDNNASLLYWTIVGLYVIPASDNSIQTFVDTAVFDVKSRKMLFRAPGVNRIDQRSTAIGVADTMTENSFKGFDTAVQDMVVNLDAELGRFKDRVKNEKIAKVEHRAGYSGSGGAIDFIFLGLMLCACLVQLCQRQWRQPRHRA
ncbi:rhombotarget lipoprotein [Simiduia litorea]|uniref:rhombotarget lipoprotein n=1 Tax=Simiduia litorea TaxID=1435348 RepID=UPI0036F3A53C